MQTPDHEQGAAIAFNLLEQGAVEDIRRYMLGLAWDAIPPSWTARHRVRLALREFGPALTQAVFEAAHQENRAQLDATGWVARNGAYIFRDALYTVADPTRLRRPTHAGP